MSPSKQSRDSQHQKIHEEIEARVLSVNSVYGVAYLEESESGNMVGVSRDFINHSAFDALREGRFVRFQRDHDVVSALTLSE